jgi:hypothetical protein
MKTWDEMSGFEKMGHLQKEIQLSYQLLGLYQIKKEKGEFIDENKVKDLFDGIEDSRSELEKLILEK